MDTYLRFIPTPPPFSPHPYCNFPFQQLVCWALLSFQKLMSQLQWFKKLSTVLLIIIAHYWDYGLNRRCCRAHFFITDDINKSNEQLTFCIDQVREYYDRKNAEWGKGHCFATFILHQRTFFWHLKLLQFANAGPNKHLRINSDKCGGQCANMYHFSWLVDYIQEDHGLQTIQHNFSGEQHGKGTRSDNFEQQSF